MRSTITNQTWADYEKHPHSSYYFYWSNRNFAAHAWFHSNDDWLTTPWPNLLIIQPLKNRIFSNHKLVCKKANLLRLCDTTRRVMEEFTIQIPLTQKQKCTNAQDLSCTLWQILRTTYQNAAFNKPSHLRPCFTKPNSISPQKSQKWGDLYEWTWRTWGRIWSSSIVVLAVSHTNIQTRFRYYFLNTITTWLASVQQLAAIFCIFSRTGSVCPRQTFAICEACFYSLDTLSVVTNQQHQRSSIIYTNIRHIWEKQRNTTNRILLSLLNTQNINKMLTEMSSPDKTTSTRVPSTMSLADVISRKTFWSKASWRNSKILSRRL